MTENIAKDLILNQASFRRELDIILKLYQDLNSYKNEKITTTNTFIKHFSSKSFDLEEFITTHKRFAK